MTSKDLMQRTKLARLSIAWFCITTVFLCAVVFAQGCASETGVPMDKTGTVAVIDQDAADAIDQDDPNFKAWLSAVRGVQVRDVDSRVGVSVAPVSSFSGQNHTGNVVIDGFAAGMAECYVQRYQLIYWACGAFNGGTRCLPAYGSDSIAPKAVAVNNCFTDNLSGNWTTPQPPVAPSGSGAKAAVSNHCTMTVQPSIGAMYARLVERGVYFNTSTYIYRQVSSFGSTEFQCLPSTHTAYSY